MRWLLLICLLMAGCTEPAEVQETPEEPEPATYEYQNRTEQFAGELGTAVAVSGGPRAGSSLIGQLQITPNSSSAVAYVNFTNEPTVNQIRVALCPSPCQTGDENAFCTGTASRSFHVTFPISGATGFRAMVADGVSQAQPVTIDVAYKEASVTGCTVSAS